MPGRDRLDHQPIAGIGDEGRAGIGDQRHRSALRQGVEKAGALLGAVMVVIGQDRRPGPPHAVDIEELAGLAGILGGQQIGPRQDVERAQRDVARRADRGRHEIEAGRQRTGPREAVVREGLGRGFVHCRLLFWGKALACRPGPPPGDVAR